MAKSKLISVKLQRDGGLCYIPVAFDVRKEFGKARAPVKVTLKGHGYRSTVFTMGGVTGIPVRKSHLEAAGLAGDETLRVKIELDDARREVEVPPELARAMAKLRGAKQRWEALSFTRRREIAESIRGAKKPETRARRLENALQLLGA